MARIRTFAGCRVYFDEFEARKASQALGVVVVQQLDDRYMAVWEKLTVYACVGDWDNRTKWLCTMRNAEQMKDALTYARHLPIWIGGGPQQRRQWIPPCHAQGGLFAESAEHAEATWQLHKVICNEG